MMKKRATEKIIGLQITGLQNMTKRLQVINLLIEGILDSCLQTYRRLKCTRSPGNLTKASTFNSWLLNTGTGDRYFHRQKSYCQNNDILTPSRISILWLSVSFFLNN